MHRSLLLSALFGIALMPGLQAQTPNPRTLDSRNQAFLLVVHAGAGNTLWPAQGTPALTLQAWLDSKPAGLELASQGIELLRTRESRDRGGAWHLGHDLYYKNRRLFGLGLNAHFDTRGDLQTINGRVPRLSLKGPDGPLLALDQVLDRLLEVDAHWQPQVESAEPVWVDTAWLGAGSSGLRPAWYILASDLERGVEQAVLVDALGGERLFNWSRVHGVRDRRIHTGNNSSALPGTLVRGENDAPSGDFDIDRAYDCYGDTYDYFLRAHGRDSVDDMGLPLVATTHSTAPPCPNAFWSSALQQMVFCNGTVTDDIVAHELTHGITSSTAALIYANQSGQLNESFSDVFGELVDLYNGDASLAGAPGGIAWPPTATGPGLDSPNGLRDDCIGDHSQGVRWLIGEDAAAFGGEIRDMWNPTCMGHPDEANSPLQTCPSGDSGGVHSGSGVPNHAFAILVDGKTFNGHTAVGIGPIKAGAIWYQCLAYYLVPSSDFEDAYHAFRLAGQSLLGVDLADPRTGLSSGESITVFDLLQLEEALKAVALDTEGACGATDSPLSATPVVLCPSGRVLFEEDFEQGLGGWSVSHTAMPTPYDWVTRGDLPLGASGQAAWCEDRQVGDCSGQDETGSHTLTSPWIVTGPTEGRLLLAFSHYFGTEPGWDGGVVRIQTPSGTTTADFPLWLFNPPNAPINAGNPWAGQAGYTGVGSTWGTSLADLTSLAAGADSLRLVFSLGKDGCTGGAGWFVDGIRLVDCADCDGNGEDDRSQFRFAATRRMNMPSTLFGETWTPGDLPPAGDTVTLSVHGRGDLNSLAEFVTVQLNGTAIGSLFTTGASDCAGTPHHRRLELDPALFNSLLTAGPDALRFNSSGDVNTSFCTTSNHLVATLSYTRAAAGDADGNGIPDTCLPLAAPAASLSYLGNSLLLAWDPVPGAQSYRVWRLTESGPELLATTAATSLDLSGLLSPGPALQVEQFRISALD
jgi:hypothetical protein